MDDALRFGRSVRTLRRALDLTQEALAAQVGCAAITLRKIEAGDLRPSEQIARRLAAALGLPNEAHDAFVRAARTTRPIDEVLPAIADPATPEPRVPIVSSNDAARHHILSSPYKGLHAFDEADASTFFGREYLIDRLVARMAEASDLARFLTIVGPSGSGKSSLARAGLIAALRRDALPGSSTWQFVDMMPGNDPISALSASLTRHVAQHAPSAAELATLLSSGPYGLLQAAERVLPADSKSELVLLIDQFEELWTLCPIESVRQQVCELLVTSVLDEHSRVRVLLTLRADYIDHPLRYVDIGELVSQRSEHVLPLTPDALERAIVLPARGAGLTFEAGLVTTIITEVGSAPGALPLLQHALSELYHRREGTTLTHTAYQAIGGVGGALSRSAEALYASLDNRGQQVAQHLMLALVNPDDEGRHTRRRVHQAELLNTLPDAMVAAILARFGDARLLTFDRDVHSGAPTVEITHEALLHAWPQLSEWVSSNRDGLLLHRRLHTAAAEWNAAGSDPSFLATGARLASFEALGSDPNLTLSANERAYLVASLNERDNAESTALRQQQEAEAYALAAQGQALSSAAQAAIAEGNLDQGRALALAAVQVPQPAPEAEALLSQAAYAPGTRRLLTGHTNAVMGVAYSLDEQSAVSVATDQTVRIWDLARGVERKRLHGLAAIPWSVAISPDGQQVLVAADDGLIYRWNFHSGARLSSLAGHHDAVTALAWHPNGQVFASASKDQTILLWDAATGAVLRQCTGHTAAVWGVSFSPDGQSLASGSADTTVRLWHSATGVCYACMQEHRDRVSSVAWSPDGTQLYSGAWDQRICRWDGKRGTLLGSFVTPDGSITSIASHPRADLLAAATGQNIRIWNAREGYELQRFGEHRDEVFSISFSHDGTSLLSGSRDNTVRLWSLRNSAEARRFSGHISWVRSVAVTRDGLYGLSGSWDWTLRLWNLATGAIQHTFHGHTDGVEAVALSPDGRLALSGSADTTVRVWDVMHGQQLHCLGHDGYVWDVAIDPSGTVGASASEDGTVRLWDLRSGREQLRIQGHVGAVNAVAWSIDGRTLLSGGADSTLRLWDATHGREIGQLEGHDHMVNSVAISPDGRFALSGAADGTARLWDIAQRIELPRFPMQAGPVLSVAWSADGQRALFAGGLSTLALWDVASGCELRRYDTGGVLMYRAVLTSDGRSLFAGATDNTLYLWHVQTLPELLTTMTEQRYVPELSQAQRDRYRLAAAPVFTTKR